MTTAVSCGRPSGADQLQRPDGVRGRWAEHVRDGVEDGPQLGISVARALHGLGVQPQRHVVDERATVDLGEVDAALATRHQRVQRAHHVVTVDAEVQGEVVACPRRDAGERQVVLGRDLGHQRLRAVASGRRQGVRSALHRRLDQLHQVLAWAQLDRFDAAGARLIGQVRAQRLATAGTGVPHDDRVARARCRGQPDPERERPLLRDDRGRHRGDRHHTLGDEPAERDHRERHDGQDRGEHEQYRPGGCRGDERPPTRRRGRARGSRRRPSRAGSCGREWPPWPPLPGPSSPGTRWRPAGADPRPATYPALSTCRPVRLALECGR